MILSLLLNWRKALAVGGAVGLLILVGGLYAWGQYQIQARKEAEGELKAVQSTLEITEQALHVEQQLREFYRAYSENTTKVLQQRDTEKESTQEALRAASWTISQLRRDNAQLREWLDRPIPADVRRVLNDATGRRDQDRKANSSPAASH